MKEFARIIGVPLKTYEHYEYATRKPTVQFVLQIVDALHVSSDYVLGLTDDPTPADKRADSGAVTVNGHGNAIANGNGNHLTQATENRFASLEARMAVIESRLAAATMKP